MFEDELSKRKCSYYQNCRITGGGVMGMPHSFDCFNSVFGYDYRIHMWVYDVKFYLNGNHWCLDENGKQPLRKVEEYELKIMRKHMHIIEEHERENAAWLAHKQCRKRSCVCKKCEKYCHCYDCAEKVISCDNSIQK